MHGFDFLVCYLLVGTYASVVDAFHYSYRVEYPLAAASSNRGLDNLAVEGLVVGLASTN
jgi:hypothetical protein